MLICIAHKAIGLLLLSFANVSNLSLPAVFVKAAIWLSMYVAVRVEQFIDRAKLFQHCAALGVIRKEYRFAFWHIDIMVYQALLIYSDFVCHRIIDSSQ
jgi:hypothetical protein